MPNTDPSGIEWVRVKDVLLGDRHLSLPRIWAEAEPERYTVLKDHDALDANGRPLPPKFSVGEPERPEQSEPDKSQKTAAAKPAK